VAQWLSFSLVVAVLTVVLLVLARQSQSMLRTQGPATEDGHQDLEEGGEPPEPNGTAPEQVAPEGTRTPAPNPQSAGPEAVDGPIADNAHSSPSDSPHSPELREQPARGPEAIELTPAALLANVAVTQGLVAGIVAAAAWYFAIPGDALGITSPPPTGLTALAVGVAFGLVLWVGNELSTTVADAVGAAYDEGVREQLAPDSPAGWAVLFFAVLPLIAVSEELLFRAALIGVPAAGFGLSPWLLAAVSSLAFALGHGAQGRVGIVVTGLLGFVLAAGYVISGSLLLVVAAHYVINALEFLVHELLGMDGPFAGLTRLSAG
jgi:membrane protease YdiL (CAAX protease family)